MDLISPTFTINIIGLLVEPKGPIAFQINSEPY